MNFYGYGVNPYIDFLFYPADSTGTKKVNYTVNAIDVRTHSLERAGFWFNCSTSGGVLNGYAMMFSYANNILDDVAAADAINSVTLFKIKNMSVAEVHNGTNRLKHQNFIFLLFI